MKRAVLALVLGPVAMVAGVVGWYVLEARARIAEKRAAAQNGLPALIAESDRGLGSSLNEPMFARPGGEDAGPWLNARLDFESVSSTTTPLLSAPCRQLMRDLNQREDQAPREQMTACDTSAFLAPGERTKAVLPKLFVLQNLAKLHRLKGHAAGQLEAAADDVRHLARLLFTAEYPLTSMFGAAMLGAPRGVSKEFIPAFRGRLWAAVWARKPILRDALPASRPDEHRFVRCVGASEEAFMRLEPSRLTDDCWFENARF